MKLLELEICNTRGIRQLTLFPNGKNFLVWGPNGSGKSTVVDALDFLLTGKITRLTGKGTGGISLNKHGPHIDCKPEDASVRAIIQLVGVKEPIEIKRCLAHPTVLEGNDAAKPYLEAIVAHARKGQFVLTRREILRYITSEGSTRAEEIQELLNLTEIEEVRKALVTVLNELGNDFQAKKRNLENAQGGVNATIKKQSYQPDTILEIVNQNRVVIGAPPIPVLHSTQLKTNIKLPTAISNERPINITLLEADIENLHNALSEQSQAEVSTYDQQLRSLVSYVHSTPTLLKTFSQYQLILLGIKMIDDNGACPLCDMPWEKNKLIEHLEKKRKIAVEGSIYQNGIIDSSTAITNRVISTLSSLQKVIAAVQLIGSTNDLKSLRLWQNNLQILSNSLNSPVENYLDLSFSSEKTKILVAPDDLAEISKRILSSAKRKFPDATLEQTAWDTLTRLEENLKSLEKAETEYNAAEFSFQRATILGSGFERARDKILKELYKSIKKRFVGLYKTLHKSDEGEFDASIEPDGAALNFEVDFFGRGNHPPHALHSEGHQDSMGLCLYLALAERLTEEFIELTILDDVVMSVDADHRKDLCHLLAREFPGRQFIITTHDKTWANQLKSEGVVTSKSSVEFYNWNIDMGPQVNNEIDIWGKIDQDLLSGDVPGASAKLRRGSEQFFSMTCDSLQALVKYRANGRWELGDFLPSSVSQYKSLLKQAKRAAQSWNDKETVKMLSEVESTLGQIYSRTNAEQWAINASVHYNNWANLHPNDFQPVVEAFQDLFGVFSCNSCGGMLYTANVALTPVSVKCNCGKVNWNLQENPASAKS